eukprot:gnl/Trimastix_PCT/4126.p1 GENE.gnl/Trimastix_PCT/4126~~gnl/Trimastix_PCT/4126.p1  ORF type:complete len:413 (+),score=81.06 gnl/Trimastix_PCT/4126:310-1548(+)
MPMRNPQRAKQLMENMEFLEYLEIPSTDITEFSASLFHHLCQPNKGGPNNVVFSPTSFITALYAVCEGSAGSTQSQLSELLRKCEGYSPEIIPTYHGLAQRGNMRFEMGTSVWAPRTPEGQSALKEAFVQSMRTAFHTDIMDNPGSVVPINAWISERTQGMISDLLNQCDPLSIILVNVLYFLGQWNQPFDASHTHERSFHAQGMAAQCVPMMCKHFNAVPYLENKDYQICDLPYGEALPSHREYGPPQFSFVATVVLPKKRYGLDRLLQEDRLREVLQSAKRTHPMEGTLYLPRFTIQGGVLDCIEALRSLGVVDAFSGAANFANMTDMDMYVSQFMHQCVLKVNEEGTEAAAATYVVARPKGLWSKPKTFEMKCDHPFLFLIRTSKMIHFMARIASIPEAPAAGGSCVVS